MENARDSVLISVKPQFSNLIEKGEKKVELRKKVPANLSGKKVYVYSTCPDSKIIGFFEAKSVESLPICQLWERVREIAGIDEKDFFEYYSEKEEGFAIFFQKFIKFEEPISLECLRKANPDFVPPQNYYYVNSDELLNPAF